MSNLAKKIDEERILSSEFLDEIKRVRELKGISQEEVSERTNIKLAYIKAIENGDIDGLPGGVYNRAYIRSVSEFLGINTKQFERKVVSDEFLDEQQIKIELGKNNFDFKTPNLFVLSCCAVLILVVYTAFYLVGSDKDSAHASLGEVVPMDGTFEEDAVNSLAETIAKNKISPLKDLVIPVISRNFTVSIIAKEQTQVEITDKDDNVILSKIFLPNETIIYPADDKEYYLYTPEIGVLDVYLDGVRVKSMPDAEKKDDKYVFTVDALFDSIEIKNNSLKTDEQKTDT